VTYIVEEPLPVYAGSEWNANISIAPGGVPIDFSVYTEITATWRVEEYNPVGVTNLESPRDQNSVGILKIRATSEQVANMKSDGVWDIFGDNQAIIKGYTVWEGKVR
jgi:hypothetical protein